MKLVLKPKDHDNSFEVFLEDLLESKTVLSNRFLLQIVEVSSKSQFTEVKLIAIEYLLKLSLEEKS